MSAALHRLARQIHQLYADIHDQSAVRLRLTLKRAHALSLTYTPSLRAYHDSLLFVCAHPLDAGTQRLANRELRRIAAVMRSQRGQRGALQQAVGMPFVTNVSGDQSPRQGDVLNRY